jgi:hypothetical protein
MVAAASDALPKAVVIAIFPSLLFLGAAKEIAVKKFGVKLPIDPTRAQNYLRMGPRQQFLFPRLQ